MRVYNSHLKNHVLQSVTWNVTLQYALDLLRLLYKLNFTDEDMRVSYETFHLPNLMNFIDIRADYLKWLMDEPSSSVGDFKRRSVTAVHTYFGAYIDICTKDWLQIG